MNNLYLETLDLDFNDKTQLSRVLVRLRAFHNGTLKTLEVRDSALKGKHIRMLLTEPCDLCRLVFDDPKRFGRDMTLRKPYQRNVLKTKKVYVNGDRQLALYAGPWESP
jgi:hypothetical protein